MKTVNNLIPLYFSTGDLALTNLFINLYLIHQNYNFMKNKEQPYFFYYIGMCVKTLKFQYSKIFINTIFLIFKIFEKIPENIHQKIC